MPGKPVNRRCRRRNEDGAATVVVAIMLPLLLIAGAMGLDAMATTGAEREQQRAADAAALTAASAIPLVSLSSLPLGGGSWSLAADAATRGCQVGTTAASTGPSTTAHATGATGCTLTFEPDDPALLTTVLNAVDPLLSTASVLRQLGHSTTNLANSIVPAVTAPRARAVVSSAVQPPLGQLVRPDGEPLDLHGEAVARRRVKNAVLLPALDLSGRCPSGTLIGGLIAWLTGVIGDILGNVATIGELATKLNQCRIDANPALNQAGSAMFPALEQVGARLDALGLPGGAMADSLLVDLRDIYQPQGSAAPTQRNVLQAAAARDEHVLIVLVGVSRSAAIPMFDVIPVLAADLLARDLSRLEMSDLFGLTATATQARGVFRATLVQ